MNEDRRLNYGLFRMFLCSLSLAIPLIIIDAPFWVISLASLFVFLPFIIPSEWTVIIVIASYTLLLRPGLYIWGLIAAINGPQDLVAIAFYIIAGLQAFSIIKDFVAYLFTLIITMSDR